MAALQYQLLPDLDVDEFAALKADIRQRGIQVPIEKDEAGAILDGHQRIRAWDELRAEGVRIDDYPRIIRAGLSEDEKFEHALVLNLQRRHLNVDQRRQLTVTLRERRWSTPRIAEILHVDAETVRSDLAGSEYSEPERVTGRDGKSYPAHRTNVMATSGRMEQRAIGALAAAPDAMPSGFIDPKRAEKIARDDQKAAVNPVGPPVTPRGLDIRCGDFREVLADLVDGSVDAIITDPPYPREHLPLYRDLALFAAQKLRPGGSCLVMCGQSYFPDILASMVGPLTYHWLGAYLTPGGQSPQIWQRKVNTFWKPLLWLVNGEYDGPWVGDVCRSDVNDNDKRFHDWGQSETGMGQIVERFSAHGSLIVDPFMGGGTTGLVSLALGRRFIGSDIDSAAVATAMERLS